MDIKAEDPLSVDVASQNGRELFIKKKTHSGIVCVKTDYDKMIKTEIKSESPFTDYFSQKEGECFGNPLIDQINFETSSCSNNWKTEFKIEIGLEKEREFLPEDTVVKYNSNNEICNKVEVKDETWWLKTQSSSINNDIDDGAVTPVKAPRLHMESVSGHSSTDSPSPSTQASMKNTSFNSGNECLKFESQEHDVTRIPPAEKLVQPAQSHKCIDGDTGRKTLKVHKVERPYKCNNCEKTFPRLTNLKRHNFIHDGKKPHQCQICEKRFTWLSGLKSHIFLHKGKRPYKCEICEKRFTWSSGLKSHTFIHEGKRPHKCEICEKRFTRLADLRNHSLTHEGKMDHKCEICGKKFTLLSNLKRHSLRHDGTKISHI